MNPSSSHGLHPIPEISPKEFSKIIDDLPHLLPELMETRIGILGDICIDSYIYGSVTRINPEAPVPVVVYEREESRLGMGANVAVNVAAFGARCWLFGICGDDPDADRLSHMLAGEPNIENGLVRSPESPTITKTRILAGTQHVVRLDREIIRAATASARESVLAQVEKALDAFDVLVLQEHAKGLFGPELSKALHEMLRRRNMPFYIDPNTYTPARLYHGAELMTPNLSELLNFCSIQSRSEYDLIEVARAFKRDMELENLIVTLGKNGMALFEGDQVVTIPSFAREVFEVSGAGDTVMAFLAMGRAAGLDLT
ncbi:MAG: bifunctional hydroxymethylpyrimidine kinase/phosphomethylpyrimidine kinase, partial [Planctomycetes bacterium]|nr:bifunctional hydroxymethylpyrimidine kinase/phosphomethylpyrimidine kinase [Planctomycetota bacterium]